LCQTEDWIVYHSKSSPEPGWKDRDVHAKRFEWSSDGFPDFGTPMPRTIVPVPVALPVRPSTRPRVAPLIPA
jgi:GH43 family beta-xylosidase